MGVRHVGSAGGYRLFRETELTIFTAEARSSRVPLLHPPPRAKNPRNLIDVMLSKAKHLAFSGRYKVEILRLRLRMTLRHSLAGEERGGGACYSKDANAIRLQFKAVAGRIPR